MLKKKKNQKNERKSNKIQTQKEMRKIGAKARAGQRNVKKKNG